MGTVDIYAPMSITTQCKHDWRCMSKNSMRYEDPYRFAFVVRREVCTEPVDKYDVMDEARFVFSAMKVDDETIEGRLQGFMDRTGQVHIIPFDVEGHHVHVASKMPYSLIEKELVACVRYRLWNDAIHKTPMPARWDEDGVPDLRVRRP